jgi:hypothetical protein
MYKAIQAPSNDPSIFKQNKIGVRMKKPMKMATNRTIKARFEVDAFEKFFARIDGSFWIEPSKNFIPSSPTLS